MLRVRKNTKVSLINRARSAYTRLLIVMVFVICIFSSLLINQLFQKLVTDSIEPIANMVSDTAVIAFITRSNEAKSAFERYVSDVPNIPSFALIDIDGELVHTNMGEEIQLNSIRNMPINNTEELGNNRWHLKKSVYLTTDSEVDFFNIDTPTQDAKKQELLGYIYLIYDNSLGASFLERYLLYFLYFMAFVLLTGQVIIRHLVVRYMKPVAEIKKVMDAYKNTNEIIPYSPTYIEEVDDLLENLDALLKMVKHQQGNIESLNSELENDKRLLKVRVKEKTEDLRKLVKTLEKKDELKTQFIANVSHEIRTPIQSIIGYAEVIRMDLDRMGIDNFEPDFQKMFINADNLLSLITRLLDFSKLQSNAMSVERETLSREQICQKIVSSVEMIAQRNQFDIKIDNTSLPTKLRVDIGAITQILTNLISNAEKFTKNGVITLDVSYTGSVLVCSVTDTGNGINPEDAESIFEAFLQTDGTYRREHGGTGIGLTISRQLAKMMSGSLSLDTEYHDGARFVLRVPCS